MQQKFLDVFKEALAIEDKEIAISDEFRQYTEWDSLAHLSLIAALDEEFGTVIEQSEFQKLLTVEDLMNKVLSNV